jgi:hypothetical protein
VIPDWKLERYRLRELSADETARIDALLKTDETLRARVQALDADDAATRTKYPHLTRTKLREGVAAAPVRSPWLMPALALAVALVGGVVALQLTRPDEDEVRFKGDGPTLHLFRLAGAEPERLDDGAKVKPHDVVQVAFELSGAKHVVIVSVDGLGHATLHWPRDGKTEAPVGFNKLPESFELDDAPGFERFFLVTSDAPLVVGDVLHAAEVAARSAPLALPKSARSRSFLLDKVTP